MCPNRLKENGFRELESYINSLDTKEEALITVLHKAQEIFGYLPKEVQEFIADKLNEPLAGVYGVVSFYSFFTMIPKGDIAISVCMGTACFVRGTEATAQGVEEWPPLSFSSAGAWQGNGVGW